MMNAKSPKNDLFAYPTKASVNALNPDDGKQIRLFSARALNNTGSAMNIGLIRMSSRVNYFTYDATTVTDVTSTVQAGNLINLCDTNAGSGLIFQSPDRFNFLSFSVSLTQTGGPTFSLVYWNGTSFTAVGSTIEVLSNYNAGLVNHVLFKTPVDWVKGDANVGSPLSTNKYTLGFFCTGSGNTPVGIPEAGNLIDFQPQVAAATSVSMNFSDVLPLQFGALEGVRPYFGTASAGNQVTLFYSQED